ncbi:MULTISPECIES: hypothetical protein [unclassified Rhizobium]|uniref:hypothetical protein n=1 Tax=unclassified Rhizobium TaxID=2613769 RepID=UPI000EB72D26|nr:MULTISPECIES: hypothetical protein [unclassified Rhizobium]AYG69313.1 hypothetical protein CCGE531_25105 [Rhizobium sp. CCGE531]
MNGFEKEAFERDAFELSPQNEAFESEQFEWGGEAEAEAEWGHEAEAEWGNEAENEWEAEGERESEAEWGAEYEWEAESEALGEAEVMELAGELLEVTNEAELDLFLGNLIRNAGHAIGQVVKSPVGQAIGGFLKSAAKKALPLAGGALGGLVGGPLGAQIGSGLASAAGNALGLEAEMEDEDREFEGAKNFVRMAGDAVNKVLTSPLSGDPAAAAKAAVTEAAGRFAPGLLPGGARHHRPLSGRWHRQGQNIVIVGI